MEGTLGKALQKCCALIEEKSVRENLNFFPNLDHCDCWMDTDLKSLHCFVFEWSILLTSAGAYHRIYRANPLYHLPKIVSSSHDHIGTKLFNLKYAIGSIKSFHYNLHACCWTVRGSWRIQREPRQLRGEHTRVHVKRLQTQEPNLQPSYSEAADSAMHCAAVSPKMLTQLGKVSSCVCVFLFPTLTHC